MTHRSAPFITVEGIDGAGKSSHMGTIKAVLAAAGYGEGDVVLTREPGGTELGTRLRKELKGTAMSPTAEALIAFASRAQHLDEVIRPALAEGKAVVSDRFTDSTFAYQGAGHGFSTAFLENLEHMVHGDLQPDVTLWFDLDPRIAQERRQARDGSAVGDKFDAKPQAWFAAVAKGYAERQARDPGRMVRIDAAGSFEEVADSIKEVLARSLANLENRPQGQPKPSARPSRR